MSAIEDGLSTSLGAKEVTPVDNESTRGKTLATRSVLIHIKPQAAGPTRQEQHWAGNRGDCARPFEQVLFQETVEAP
jgi:hypothetical protein